MISELIGPKKPAFSLLFTQITVNFIRLVFQISATKKNLLKTECFEQNEKMLMFVFPFSLLNGLLVAACWFKNFSFKKGNEGSHSGYPFTKMKTEECTAYICHKLVKKAKNNMNPVHLAWYLEKM